MACFLNSLYAMLNWGEVHFHLFVLQWASSCVRWWSLRLVLTFVQHILEVFHVFESSHHAFDYFDEFNLSLLAELFLWDLKNLQELQFVVTYTLSVRILNELKINNKSIQHQLRNTNEVIDGENVCVQLFLFTFTEKRQLLLRRLCFRNIDSFLDVVVINLLHVFLNRFFVNFFDHHLIWRDVFLLNVLKAWFFLQLLLVFNIIDFSFVDVHHCNILRMLLRMVLRVFRVHWCMIWWTRHWITELVFLWFRNLEHFRIVTFGNVKLIVCLVTFISNAFWPWLHETTFSFLHELLLIRWVRILALLVVFWVGCLVFIVFILRNSIVIVRNIFVNFFLLA